MSTEALCKVITVLATENAKDGVQFQPDTQILFDIATQIVSDRHAA